MLNPLFWLVADGICLVWFAVLMTALVKLGDKVSDFNARRITWITIFVHAGLTTMLLVSAVKWLVALF